MFGSADGNDDDDDDDDDGGLSVSLFLLTATA